MKPHATSLKADLRRTFVITPRASVLESFGGMIHEGIEKELYTDYASDLKRELKRVGVTFNPKIN